MKSITKQKTFEEIEQQLDGFDRVYIAGCGTCATMTKTGGKEEVLAMKERLKELGKLVTGWIVIPTACDEMTEVAIKENNGAIQNAKCILVMACALGVHKLCVLGETAGICPLTACHKGLLNGPCGGTDNGKCEVDKEKDCAWTLIYQRLEKQGRLDLMRKYHSPRDCNVALRPRTIRIT
jgi:hypothetical protein